MARAGIASRRASEELIESGRVTVNGKVAKLGEKADLARDEVAFDGELVSVPDKHVVIALNKPVGYVSAMKDGRSRKCASELLPMDAHPSLFHVGRLDADTSGLLLFTTDGELGNRLAHPSHEVMKTYVARVKGCVSEDDIKRLEEGVMLKDGMTSPAQARLLSAGRASVVELKIHEGRNRQVRRMMEALGHPVISLQRVAIGNLTLDGIPEGAWRELTDEDIQLLLP